MFQLLPLVQVYNKGALAYHHRRYGNAMQHPHRINHIDVVRVGNGNTGGTKNEHGHQCNPVPAKTIQQAAYKKLRQAVADQEKTQRELRLAVGNTEGMGHTRQRWKVNIRGKTRHGDHSKSQQRSYSYIVIPDPLPFNNAGSHITVAGGSFTAKLQHLINFTAPF